MVGAVTRWAACRCGLDRGKHIAERAELDRACRAVLHLFPYRPSLPKQWTGWSFVRKSRALGRSTSRSKKRSTRDMARTRVSLPEGPSRPGGWNGPRTLQTSVPLSLDGSTSGRGVRFGGAGIIPADPIRRRRVSIDPGSR